MNKRMTSRNKILRAHENLFIALGDFADSSHCGELKYKAIESCFSQDADVGTFECYLHCKNWKWDRASTKDGARLSIILKVQETVDLVSARISSSVVNVSYIAFRGEEFRKPVVLQSMHYDFDPNQDHALFHAQMCEYPVRIPMEADSIRQDLGIDFDLPEKIEGHCHPEVRMPTSDMTISSVLLCLAHDHFKAAVFQKFREKLREIVIDMPRPDITKLKASLDDEPETVRSWHWFVKGDAEKSS